MSLIGQTVVLATKGARRTLDRKTVNITIVYIKFLIFTERIVTL